MAKKKLSNLFFRATIKEKSEVKPGGKSVIFKYKSGEASSFVLKEILHLVHHVNPERWTGRLIIPKNKEGCQLPHSAFFLQLVMTAKGPYYTATYCEVPLETFTRKYDHLRI
ncbi:hypothetical protein NPIL_294661 [Nephila pilipes]|uniref:Uncharacterized protein n=1 Tax=Nephila pilipes TaxID=299642 RepID=A0A8X6P223_NEPPI|nr:hypothetical protein NPIL_294661 [Nephila pilipes]